MVEQYERLVYTICYQLVHDAQLAEDLSQDTFLSAYTHLDSCPAEAVKPWLARIASNKAKDYLKSAYHRRVAATDDAALVVFPAAALSSQPEDITLSRAEAQAIRDEILALREPYREAARMFFLGEESVEEIARRLKRPPKTVHTQLYRAKQMLREALERRARNGAV